MNQFIASKDTFDGGDSPNSAAKAGSSNTSETSSGFKSFWKRSDKNSQTKNVTFVQQDPTAKRSEATSERFETVADLFRTEQSRIGRLLKQGGKGDVGQEGEGSGPSEGQRRRQQVYQAQKYAPLINNALELELTMFQTTSK